MAGAKARAVVAAVCWLAVLHGGHETAQAQQAMPPSVAFPEALPAEAAPVILSPSLMDLSIGPAQQDVPAVGWGVNLPNYGAGGEPWTWQLLPSGVIYKAYLAAAREPRLGSQFVHMRAGGWVWDSTIGGHVGLLRYGDSSSAWPEGWQLDLEGAVFPRIALDERRDLVAADYRCGAPVTFRRGPLESKFGYYHVSSHLGDEFMLAHPAALPIHFTRDSLVWGVAVRPRDSLRLYAEADWSFHNDGGSKPWQFQFGVDYSPAEPSRLAPFLALNSRLREDVDFSGNLTVQAGLQWRGQGGQLLRLGAHYFNGLSDQAQMFRDFEEQIGLGVWYDF